MANKRPWKVGPSMGGRQAYVHTDENGTAWIRQSLRTEDGRVLLFDMSPGEVASLINDLETAARDIIAGEWANPKVAVDRPEDRF